VGHHQVQTVREAAHRRIARVCNSHTRGVGLPSATAIRSSPNRWPHGQIDPEVLARSIRAVQYDKQQRWTAAAAVSHGPASEPITAARRRTGRNQARL